MLKLERKKTPRPTFTQVFHLFLRFEGAFSLRQPCPSDPNLKASTAPVSLSFDNLQAASNLYTCATSFVDLAAEMQACVPDSSGLGSARDSQIDDFNSGAWQAVVDTGSWLNASVPLNFEYWDP